MKQKLLSLAIAGLVLAGSLSAIQKLNDSMYSHNNSDGKPVQTATINRPEPWSMYETAAINRPEPW